MHSTLFIFVLWLKCYPYSLSYYDWDMHSHMCPKLILNSYMYVHSFTVSDSIRTCRWEPIYSMGWHDWLLNSTSNQDGDTVSHIGIQSRSRPVIVLSTSSRWYDSTADCNLSLAMMKDLIWKNQYFSLKNSHFHGGNFPSVLFITPFHSSTGYTVSVYFSNIIGKYCGVEFDYECVSIVTEALMRF